MIFKNPLCNLDLFSLLLLGSSPNIEKPLGKTFLKGKLTATWLFLQSHKSVFPEKWLQLIMGRILFCKRLCGLGATVKW